MSELVGFNRRRFLIGLGGLFAAPAIVRATSLMPIKALEYCGPIFSDPFATYDSWARWEELADLIYQITPAEKPFVSLLSSHQLTSVPVR